MKIEQFNDKGLAHYSYAILSECQREIVLIDPARDPQPYYDFAQAHQARIVGIIETHPHADFVSSHLEIHQTTGATIYTHSLVGAEYPYVPFDEGAQLSIGKIKLKSLHTPGHSPDGISIVLEHEGNDKAVFTGDTLFIGDVGRPDLRENAGDTTTMREGLARQLYHSTRQKLIKLADNVWVYPAHGAGSLCGKGLSEANRSTIGLEKVGNYALQPMSEDDFVALIIADQPFTPLYFTHDVALNKQGAPPFRASVERVTRLPRNYTPEKGVLIVDGRSQQVFKDGHLKGAINIQDGAKFETWLGSIVAPQEPYYLVADSEEKLSSLLAKVAKIGYEHQTTGVFVVNGVTEEMSPAIDLDAFTQDPGRYTIVDVRHESEVDGHSVFANAINIPLPQLRQRAGELPTQKPLVVHCAGGYRSAAGASILQAQLPGVEVLDLSEAVSQFA